MNYEFLFSFRLDEGNFPLSATTPVKLLNFFMARQTFKLADDSSGNRFT